jgi:hypothetical protein
MSGHLPGPALRVILSTGKTSLYQTFGTSADNRENATTTDEEIAKVNLKKNPFNGDWNYIINPSV